MHPGDFHLVLTTEATISYGGYFFSKIHLLKSVSCLALALFTERSSNVHIFRILLRLLPSWARYLHDPPSSKREDYSEL